MSVEVLRSAGGRDIKQKPAHDLESMFYILLYICLLFKGPGNTKKTASDWAHLPSMPITEWFGVHQRFRDLADKKAAHLLEIDTRFFDRFPAYFMDLCNCMSQLWNVLFPSQGDELLRNLGSCKGTHEEMLKILQLTYKQLPLNEAPASATATAPSRESKKHSIDDLQAKMMRRHTTHGSTSSHSTHGMVRRSMSNK